MISAYNKVSKRLPAGYDEGAATVLSHSDNRTRRTGAMLLRGAAFWRVVYVDQTGKISGEIMAPEMTRALFSSTGR